MHARIGTDRRSGHRIFRRLSEQSDEPGDTQTVDMYEGGRGIERFGGATQTQDTSFDIIATPFGSGNFALRLPCTREGLAAKIYNV